MIMLIDESRCWAHMGCQTSFLCLFVCLFVFVCSDTNYKLFHGLVSGTWCQVSYVRCQVSCIMCHVSCVMCHVSCVMCQVSGVRCQVSDVNHYPSYD